MSKLLKVGDFEITPNIKEFAYDGCHKIYLIEDEEDKDNLINWGYCIYNIEDLENCYNSSCSLKFINTCKLKEVIPQFAEVAEFTYDDKISYIKYDEEI